ncbi:MAG: hypothetical protein JNL32_04005 [Candidatus Kapabacteria bacterium]|nr:hypothetical protein [Candidatus Kapabacteria bacterium]
MKKLNIVFSLFAVLAASSCTNTNEPDSQYDCQHPISISTAKAGSYWVYKRTDLDPQGNALNVTGFDTLRTISVTSLPNDENKIRIVGTGVSYSQDSVHKDSIDWSISPTQFKVYDQFSREIFCKACSSIPNYKLINDCVRDKRILADNTFIKNDSIPLFNSNGNVVYTIIERKVSNSYSAFGNEDAVYGSQRVKTKKSMSSNSMFLKILEPDSAVFTWNGKKEVSMIIEHTVWINSTIGIIKERVHITSYNSNSTEYYERSLVNFVKK